MNVNIRFEQEDDSDAMIVYVDGEQVGQVETVCGEWFARPIGADDYAEQSFKGRQTAGEWLAHQATRNVIPTSGQANVTRDIDARVPAGWAKVTGGTTVAPPSTLWAKVTGGIGRGGFVIVPNVVPTVADVDDAPEVKIGAKVNGATSGAAVWAGARNGRTRCAACNGRAVPAMADGSTASHKIVKHHGFTPTMADGSEAQRCDGTRRKSADTGAWEPIPTA